MPFVERENLHDGVPLGKDYDRRIGKPDLEISIALDYPLGGRNILPAERLELVRTARDLFQQGNLGGVPNVTHEQVVEFRKYERRQQQGRRCFVE